jgi:hypothetical protein
MLDVPLLMCQLAGYSAGNDSNDAVGMKALVHMQPEGWQKDFEAVGIAALGLRRG